MSASSVTVRPEVNLRQFWLVRLLPLVEILIGLLWILGALEYLRAGGHYAVVLLAAALVLVVPRQIQLIAGLRNSAAQTGPQVWMLLLGVFLPEHLSSAGTVIMPHLLPLGLAATCLLVDTLVGATTSAEGWISIHHRAATVLTGFVILYAVGTTALAILKLHRFGYVGQDIGYFMQCLYTGLHGELFASNQYHDLLYTHTVTSDFAGHNQPVLFLLLPIYWIYPHAETLFIFRNLCMAISAYPAYQLARYRLHPFPALALTMAFLLAPSVLFQGFYDYAPLSLAAMPLLFGILFYERRQFGPYLASLLLCLFVREDLALVVLGLAIVALVTRRERKWVLVPGLIGLSWCWITWAVVLPHFQQGAVSAVESCFSYLGNGPGAMLHSILVHPRQFMTHKAMVYSKQLLTPFGLVLPFASPVSLVAFPLYLINVLGDPGCNSAIVFRHYSLIPSILLLPGVILAVRFIATHRKIPVRVGTVALAVLLASIGTTALSVGPTEIGWWRSAPWHQEAGRIAAQLPAAVKVAVPRYMLPFTANREKVYQTLRLLDYHHPDAEMVVIDRNDQRMGVTATWQDHYQNLLEQLKDARRFQLIYSSPDYQIYRLVGAPLQSLRPASGGRDQ
jgi:uncharacterized membrane protein